MDEPCATGGCVWALAERELTLEVRGGPAELPSTGVRDVNLHASVLCFENFKRVARWKHSPVNPSRLGWGSACFPPRDTRLTRTCPRPHPRAAHCPCLHVHVYILK